LRPPAVAVQPRESWSVSVCAPPSRHPTSVYSPTLSPVQHHQPHTSFLPLSHVCRGDVG
jgi:hypothetical protein